MRIVPLIVFTCSALAVGQTAVVINLLAPSSSGNEQFLIKPTKIPFFDQYLSRIAKTPKPTVDDVTNSPIYVMVDDDNGQTHLIYLDGGLKDFLDSPKESGFGPINDYLSPPGVKYGLVFRPTTSHHTGVLDLEINEAPIPKDFTIGNLLRVLVARRQLPFVYLADISVIDDLGFKYENLGELSGKNIRNNKS